MLFSKISLYKGILVTSFLQICVSDLIWYCCQKSCLTGMRWSSLVQPVSESCLEIMILFYGEVLYLPGRVDTSWPERWIYQTQLQNLWKERIFAFLVGADGRYQIVDIVRHLQKSKTVQAYMILPPSSRISISV